MPKRTTIEIDEEILSRAQAALDQPTIRGTVEEALRRAASQVEHAREARTERQRSFLEDLATLADLDELATSRMWR